MTIFTLVGPHAGETPAQIFERKLRDQEHLGYTLWAYRSSHCTPKHFETYRPLRVMFVVPTTKNGAKQTKTAHLVASVKWSGGEEELLDLELSPVTGTKNCSVMKITNLALQQGTVDFSMWDDATSNKPLKFCQFFSTCIGVPVSTYTEERDSRNRFYVATADVLDVGRSINR